MMTPRGVSDVQVYTPERVEARYGIRPDQIPDFIGLKGHLGHIPASRHRRQDAGQLIAQYGSVDEVIAHADALSPARRKNVIEFAEQARLSKDSRRCGATSTSTATRRARPRAAGPSELREMFRRFEFRGLLNRIDLLEEAVPAPTGRRRRYSGSMGGG